MTRVVLHVGQPKAGSTALQRALCEAAETLRDRGILYPMEAATVSRRMDGQSIHSHNLLAGVGVPFESLYAPLRQYYVDQRGLDEALQRFTDDVHRQLASRAYETLVLSGEMISEASCDALFALRDWMKQSLGLSDIDVCLYVRSPVDAYRSRIMQDVKAALDFTPPDAFLVDYRGQVERLSRVFGTDAVHPVRFGSDNAPWDAVGDFAERFLGVSLQGRRLNEALALEATFFLAAYWNACRVMGPLGRTKYELLVSWLESNPYTTDGRVLPRLRSSAVECLLGRHQEQLAWLSSRGVDFATAQSTPRHLTGSPAAALEDVFESVPSPEQMRAFDVFVVDGLLHACVVMNEALNGGG